MTLESAQAEIAAFNENPIVLANSQLGNGTIILRFEVEAVEGKGMRIRGLADNHGKEWTCSLVLLGGDVDIPNVFSLTASALMNEMRDRLED